MKPSVTVLLALVAGLFNLQSCHYAAKDIYTSRSFKRMARQHKTNAILEQKDIQPEELHHFSPTELAHLLGVDGVLTGTIIHRETIVKRSCPGPGRLEHV